MRGPARLGVRTKELVKKLRPAEIAIIDHRDLDRVSAEELASSGVRAVVNVARCSTGRYPNAGPLILARSGVRLVEATGAPLFQMVADGQELEIDGEGAIHRDGEIVATGRVLDAETLALELERRREEIGAAVAEFARNTLEHMSEESEILAGRIEVPQTRTSFRDRHVLIVVRGTDYRKDLKALRAYIRDVKPLLVGVDGGADAILDQGLEPQVVLGDMDSASDRALRSGAELVVHAYPSGEAPGHERLERLGLAHVRMPAPGTSQDAAMLLAREKGASLIVMVGAHFNLTEFLDRDRDGMSSTFLTRLRIGEILVDAKGVSRLYRPSVGRGVMGIFALAVLLLVVIVVLTSPALGNLLDLLWLKLRVLLDI